MTGNRKVNPNGSVLTIVKLQREGTLQKGDVVATDVLGPCEFVNGLSTSAIRVCCQATGKLVVISGIEFPASVTMRQADPRDLLVQRTA